MKTKIALALLVLSFTLFGKEVPADKARMVAENFLILNASPVLKGSANVVLTQVRFSTPVAFSKGMLKSATTGADLIYLFEINENDGFIVVSGDDEATPILGYSLANNMDVTRMPDNFRKWMEGYKSQIRYRRSNPQGVSREIEDQWELLIAGKSGNEMKSSTAVGPLITTRWSQSPYYNDLCPYDPEYGENSVTGCVATAMAQIMKYWNYPETGNGFHSYNHSNFGIISANFGSTRYDWGAMTNDVLGENPAVATLMFHCGVSVDMNYSANSSGAYVVSDESPVEHCAEYAFREYFSYAKSLKGVVRENYTTSAWIDLLKTELEAGRPIEYAGFGSGGGHAFVCDGVDPNDFFHFNWGWGGYYDGYFVIDALDPSGTGTGGGSGGYNSGHQAIIGIMPPEGGVTVSNLALFDDLTISDNPLFFLDPFSIHTDIANFGTAVFSGDFGAAVFDDDYNFVEFAGITEGETLEVGYHYTDGLTFSNPGSLNMLPGDYYAGAFYRPTGGNWIAVDDGSYSNLLSFSVYYSSDIELYKDFIISTGSVITQNEPFTVTADILNDGTSAFVGDFSIDLYDMEGAYAANVGERKSDSLQPGYYYSEVVFTTGGVSIDPGTYLLALLHKPDGGDWTLSGSSYFSNPVKIIVREAPLYPDMYEDNDSIPYMFTLNFSDNSAAINSEGSNSHVGTDIDLYGMWLEEGFDYNFTARVHDSYNSGNQEVYTNDVLWLYYANDELSDIFDDVMPGSVEVPGGGLVLFGVAPYFEGETGTYLLEVHVNRTVAVSARDSEENRLKIYPNPASDLITIEGTDIITRLELFDVKGRMIRSADTNSTGTSLDISNLSGGTYFLHVTQQDHTTVHKIEKQ
jgi:hypothetical protein